MYKWELKPCESIGPIKFGMDRSAVRKIIEIKCVEFQKSKYSTINEQKSETMVKMHKRELSDHSQKGRLLPPIKGKVKNKRNPFNTNFLRE